MSLSDKYIHAIWNAAEERMQEIAQAELESCDPSFVEWLCDQNELRDFAALISAACVVEGAFARDVPAWDNLHVHVDRLREDYFRFRLTCRHDMDDLYADCERDEDERALERQHEDAANRATEAEHEQLRR